MASIIMWNVVSLDGYFDSRQPWELPWHEPLWSEDLEELSLQQLHSADALLFGRKTYEGMASYWSTATDTIAGFMNALPKYVVSRTLTKADWNNTTIISGSAVDAIRQLKTRLTKGIYVFGSADLLHSLIAAGLVDEFRIGIAPHLHGSGSLLFKEGLPAQDLHLVEVRPIKKGGILAIYRLRDQ